MNRRIEEKISEAIAKLEKTQVGRAPQQVKKEKRDD